MPTIPSPVAQWEEPPENGAALSLVRAVWKYDAPSTTWTLSSRLTDQAGELVDVGAVGVYALLALGTSPSDPRLRATTRSGTTIFY